MKYCGIHHEKKYFCHTGWSLTVAVRQNERNSFRFIPQRKRGSVEFILFRLSLQTKEDNKAIKFVWEGNVLILTVHLFEEYAFEFPACNIRRMRTQDKYYVIQAKDQLVAFTRHVLNIETKGTPLTQFEKLKNCQGIKN